MQSDQANIATEVADALTELLDWADLHPVVNKPPIPPYRVVNIGVRDLERFRTVLARFDGEEPTDGRD